MTDLAAIRDAAARLRGVVHRTPQLTAILNWNLLHGPVLTRSVLLTGLALLGMWGGVKVQDTIPQRAFNRAVLGFLFVSGLGLLWRAARLIGG